MRKHIFKAAVLIIAVVMAAAMLSGCFGGILSSYTPSSKKTTEPKSREIVLTEILKEFDVDRVYSEKEVNDIILRYHDDFCTIRREMVAFGMMTRDRERYKRIK